MMREAEAPSTVRTLAPAIGETFDLSMEHMRVRVRIIDLRTSWGRVQALVRPVAGVGQQWVDSGRLCPP